MIDCNKLELKRPRSMQRVLSDIEFLIQNEYSDINPILEDIEQLKGQLKSLENSVKERDNKKAFFTLNPSFNYYK